MIAPAERMTEDDRAQAAAEQFVERALIAQRTSAAKSAPVPVPGVCRNCGEQPIAGLYCDADGRADHERRARRG